MTSSPPETDTPRQQETEKSREDGDEVRTDGHAVERDVISDGFEQPSSSSPASSPPPTTTAAPSPLAVAVSPRMPGLVDLTDLTLNSPSSQIIGTPFTTNATRFEYPFPETSASPGQSSSSPDNSPNFISSFIGMGNSYSGLATSSISAGSSSSQTVLGLYPPSLTLESALPVYSNPTHPKMRTRTEPPIPPSLAKKRNKWSLNLLLRRRSSQGSAGTAASDQSVMSGASGGGSTQAMSPTSSMRLLDGSEGPPTSAR